MGLESRSIGINQRVASSEIIELLGETKDNNPP